MNHAINNKNNQTLQTVNTDQSITTASDYGYNKIHKGLLSSLVSSIFAGMFIAIAFIFYITVTTGASAEASWGITKLAGGVVFSLGLILVVVCGSELFTSTVLSSVAWGQKRITTMEMLGCWLRVYLGNFIGAILMLLLVVGAKMYLQDGGQWGINAMHIAQHKLHHTWLQAFSLGILCNLLVCLGVWMTFTTKDILTKLVLVILPVAMFVSSGFEHSIANMFMVPLGIAFQHLFSPELLAQLGYSSNAFADLTISHFIVNNLIPVTLGNIVGGAVIVGLGNWVISQASAERLKESDL